MASTQQVAAGARVPAGGQSPAGTGPAGAHASAGASPVAASPDAGAQSTGSALVPSPRRPGELESEPGFGPLVARLPVELDVAVPVREFRVRNLLALEPGTVIESRWNHGNDLPLAAGDVTLAWTEFEVIETQLGVRVTRLA
jgi:flagellar motor switch/type III secretory pathway protein FliN